MKKISVVLIFLIFAFSLFTVNVYGVNIDEYNKEEYDASKIFNELTPEAREALSSLGITDESLESVFSVSFKKLFDVLFQMFKGSLKKPFSVCLLSIVTLAFSSFGENALRHGKILSGVGNALAMLTAAVPLGELISTVFSLTESLCRLNVAFLGVFCAAVSAAGGSISAVSFEGAMLLFNSLVLNASSLFSKPLINGMCAAAFFSCINSFSFTSRLSEMLKKAYITLLGFFGMIFTGFLSLKNVLAANADTIASKSIKFVIGKSLPVVGGAVSDSYLTVLSGLSLVKNTLGVFGIISIALTVLPTLFSLFSWSFALWAARSAFETFSSGAGKNALSVFGDAVSLLTATVVFVASVFIISTGTLLLVTRGGSV